MLRIPRDTQEQLVALAKQQCQSYLELHQKLRASYSELPNDDYLVGTGLVIEDGAAEDRLEQHYKLAADQVHKFIEPLSSLKAPEKNTLYSFTKKYIYDFCVDPSQDKITRFHTHLPRALDTLLSPIVTAPLKHITSSSLFQQVKKPKNELKAEEERPQYNP
jgi:hypothetical protein